MSASAVGDPVSLPAGALGVITDIHGNVAALETVLAHGNAAGVERWLVLGDVVAMGPQPAEVLEMLTEVDVVGYVSGNTERYVLTGERPDPSFDEVAADPTMLQRLVDVAATFAWTKGVLHGQGWLDHLASFQPSIRLRLADGTNVCAIHASLHSDDGPGITPTATESELDELFADPGASLIFGGHTHRQTDRTHGGVRYVNPGSVSSHHEPANGAQYAIVHTSETDHRVELHDLDYDKARTIEAIRASGIPGSPFLLHRYFAVAKTPY